MRQEGNKEVLEGCAVLPPLADRRSGLESDSCKPAPREPNDGGQPTRAAGRFHTFNTFIDNTLAEISATEALVWIVLWRDSKAGRARSSHGYIAARVGVCRKTVGRALRRLTQKGLVAVVRRGGFRRGPSIYRVRALPAENVVNGTREAR